MLLRYPVWDVSYDVAAIFTLGPAVWVLNGFLVLLPSVDPAGSWAGEAAWGGGVSAAVGATIFEFGSVLLMLEAVNENRSDCFGWALDEALGGGGGHGGGGGGGFTGLPQVLGVLTVPAENGIYWLPQVVGGTGFILSSWLFMLETQPNWHTPSPTTLGWHIWLWNLIGAVGFTLCGALGFVGSFIQWYESLDKYPVTVVDRKAAGPGSSSSRDLKKL
ncbi:putative integral membrane protein [Diaporthe ampelina]|uniref:Putative integral membrane protein n=1 Tax=Diaporthe ampelina TaxID=1214573 RepID=A0A0G2FCT3_9PEZI|nr:putative integral membrane protein [Diaporthe ampelina]